MGGKGVHRRVQRGRGVVLADGQNPVPKLLAVTIPHKAEDSVFKGVVHGRVELAAGQIFPQNAVTHLVGRVLPHFADQQFIVPVALDGPADLRDKRVGQFIRNVQPEAVCAPFHPGVDYAALPADERGVAGVKLVDGRQGADPPPACILVGPVLEIVPVIIGAAR